MIRHGVGLENLLLKGVCIIVVLMTSLLVVNFFVKEENVLSGIQDYIEYIPLKTFISVHQTMLTNDLFI